MKCPKCGYTSFPYLESCRKCGQGLAEVRKFLGVYALPPNPPDLMLAHHTPQADAMGPAVADMTPAVNLRRLEGIELDLATGIDEATPPTQQPAAADPSQDVVTAFDLDTEIENPRSSPIPASGDTGDQDVIELDLSDLEGLTIELREVAEEEESKPTDLPSNPAPTAAEEPIFDLEEEEEPLSHTAAAEPADLDDDAREPPPEYILLELDEELELEVDELEDADDEDDDDPDH